MQHNKELIPRKLIESIKTKLFRNKAIIIYGPRQVGKTTLVNSILSGIEIDNSSLREKTAYVNGDDSDVREILSNPNVVKLEGIIGKAKILFIDEAQRIPEIGIIIKIIVDRIKDVQVIATGSSSFLLSQSIREPLTGRAFEFVLFSLTFGELVDHTSLLDEKRKIEKRLIYGSYPEIANSPGEEKELLELLSGSYLYRDLFMLETVSRPELLEKITKAIALQVGSEVSTIEIGQLVGADRLTVEKYIDLLERAFIIFKLTALKRNVRNEIKKGKKIYFYDNGIRNAVIKNFNGINSRNDAGALWENYCISERMKYLAYTKSSAQSYFWRTTQQQEIDYLEEETENNISAFEFKLNPLSKAKFSKTFIDSYPVKLTKVITQGNIEEFIL
ncbi:MAG: ATP-binding protein [Bacteroidetes bacterium]|nr:ATP-binding protein [Bacteroidota bacterium]